ncbi:MAG TPA: DUF2079 domain-containing protein [Ilumatobacteraceae bacterium]|nr:DUF2079 domain-containing protein [Ilumatobacteraceae bacterium]
MNPRNRPPPTLRRRVNSQMMRWQARLEAGWGDRYLPWGFAAVLTLLYFTLAEARARSLDAGTDLAGAVQGMWLISHGHAPDVTITGSHLLAQHLPIGLYPIAYLTRLLPSVPTLLMLQALGIALGVVPLWMIARNVAGLRVGAAVAISVAYGASPTLNNLNLSDFHPAAVAVAPLLAATLFALQKQWRAFAIMSFFAVIWSAELGLVVAGLGVLIIFMGDRKIGTITIIAGLSWTLVAVLVLEPRYGSTGFIAPGAFKAYGSTAFSIVGGMIVHPHKVLGDLLDAENIRLIVALLAPLLFLPVLAPRFLAPALGLEALYLVADVPVRGNGTNEFGLPLTIFAFVAAIFALQRLGRRSIERVVVDRRVLAALVVAAIGFFCTDALNSPYQRPWNWGREDTADLTRHQVANALPQTTKVRASATMLPLLAERPSVYALTATPDARAAVADKVERVVVTDQDVHWDTDQCQEFRGGMSRELFVLTYERDGVRVYTRLSSP